MNILKSGSIRKRYTLGQAAVITVVMLTLSFVLIFYNSKSIEKELRGQLNRLTVLSKESLSSALWQYNYNYVEDYIKSLFLYEDLVFASVTTNETEIARESHPGFKELSFAEYRQSQAFFVAESTITHKQVNVGSIRLVISRERVRKLVIFNSALAILMLFLLNMAIFGTNYLLSSWYLFKPLSKLESTVKIIAAGNLNAFIDVSSKDEIGQLARSFRQMMENLKRITASRNDLNQEIQERERIERELKGSLKEKEILLKEVHHRVKNNLQIVHSLLNLQGGKSDSTDLKQAIQDANNRLRSMALIHETLYRSNDFSHLDIGTYFESIIKGLNRIYHDPEKNVAWTIEVKTQNLNLDKSIACGLIINELVTNTFKYAFINQHRGRIHIRLTKLSPKKVELTVADDGAGLPDGIDIKSSDSLGLQIVSMLSEDQLEGSIDIIKKNGLTVKIQFPV